MITPEEADALLDEQFNLSDPSELRGTAHRGRKSSEGGASLELLLDQQNASVEPTVGDALRAISPTQDRLDLNAYLACALTGLDSEQYKYMALLSDTIASVCAGHGIDLYEPRKVTDPNQHPDVEPSDVFQIDRNRVV